MCVKFFSVCSVLWPLSWEELRCWLYPSSQSQGCWDNLEIRSLPETKIVFTSGQNYLMLLSSSQMIFHCSIPWLQNAWTCSHSWASCQITDQENFRALKISHNSDQNRSYLHWVCLNLLWCLMVLVILVKLLCSQFDTSSMLLLIKFGFAMFEVGPFRGVAL